MTKLISGAIGIAVFAAVASLGVSAQQNQMSFFITSAGPGNGANLGGLAGADKVLSNARSGRRSGQPHVARVFERRGRGRAAGGERARSHRQGAVDECEGCGGRQVGG